MKLTSLEALPSPDESFPAPKDCWGGRASSKETELFVLSADLLQGSVWLPSCEVMLCLMVWNGQILTYPAAPVLFPLSQR